MTQEAETSESDGRELNHSADGRDRLPVSEWAYRTLREKILSSELPGRSRLVELGLAKDFGVSRTPIREALKRLAAEDLVITDPVLGLIVKPIERREVEDLYTIREALDALAAGLAARRILPEELSRLAALVDIMEQAAHDEQHDILVRANVHFHESIFRASGNERLQAIGRGLTDAVQRLSSVAFRNQRRDLEVVEEHRAVVAALERGDVDAARQAAAQHMARAKARFVRDGVMAELLRDPAAQADELRFAGADG